MERLEILLKINEINRDINNLTSSRNKYQSMNIKINDAITKLQKADDYLYNSYRELEKNYSSSEAKKKVNSLQGESTQVNSIIRELNSTILTASNRKIKSINSQITNKENEKKQLKNQLDKII